MRLSGNTVEMKDLVQAWASWKGQPHIAFSRAGSLLDGQWRDEDISLYDSVYRVPFEESRNARQQEQLAERLLAHDLLLEVLKAFSKIIKTKRRKNSPNDIESQELANIKIFKSSTHHIVWIYSELLRPYLDSGMTASELLPLVPELVSITFENILDNLRGTLAYLTDIAIPRDLKSDKVTQVLHANGFAKNAPGQRIIVDALHQLIQG